MASSGQGFFEAFQEKLQSRGLETYTMEEMESWDTSIKNFDLNKGSKREFVEGLNWEVASRHWGGKEWLLWQAHRLAAFHEKLSVQRREREERLYALERQHEEGLEALRLEVEAMEEELRGQDADLTMCEMLLARRGPPAEDTDAVPVPTQLPDTAEGEAAALAAAPATAAAEAEAPRSPPPEPPAFEQPAVSTVAPPALVQSPAAVLSPAPAQLAPSQFRGPAGVRPPAPPVPTAGLPAGKAPPSAQPATLPMPRGPAGAEEPPQPPSRPCNDSPPAASPPRPAEAAEDEDSEEPNPWASML